MTVTQCWHRIPGGLATSVEGLLRALVDLGGIDAVAVGARGPGRCRCELPPTVPLERLRVPLPVLYDAWHLLGRPGPETVAGHADLVHLTVPVAPRPGPTPWVATVHDLFPLTRPTDLNRRGVRLAARGLGRIRDHATLVAVPSDAVARDCHRHGFDPGRVRVVPWGVHRVRVHPDAVGSVRERRGLRGPYVLFVGTLEPRKGLDVLADALVLLDRPGLTLVVAGASGWGPDARERFAGVPSPVRWAGHVPTGELDALRAGAAVCCVPARAEGFGLPALEALAAGAPVVTTEGTAMAEVVGDAALLVPPGDPAALAGALADVLDDPALADRLRREGSRRAAAFDPADTARAYRDLYLEAMGGPR